MNQKPRRRKQRRCAHCGKVFVVDPRIGGRHRYCAAVDCLRASHLSAQRKWRDSPKGKDYFRGWQNVERVRLWRQEHPGYGRRVKRGYGEVSAVLAAELRRISLQDSIDPRVALLVGLISKVSNLALQDLLGAAGRHYHMHDHRRSD